jgi:purine-binding chemotaxis protein CheW
LTREPQTARGGSAGAREAVEFVLAAERYAIEGVFVREVYPLKDVTPLPCTPPFVLGIVNVRGTIVAVLDVRKLFDLPAAGLTDLNRLIILESPEVRAGILADAIVGVRAIAPDELQPPLPTMSAIGAEYLRGITRDGVALLDAARVLADERIVVNEEVR